MKGQSPCMLPGCADDGRLFCAIWIFTDLTKKRIGGILKERECPNIWSSPQVSFCPKRTQDRYSGSDWAVIFFLFYL